MPPSHLPLDRFGGTVKAAPKASVPIVVKLPIGAETDAVFFHDAHPVLVSFDGTRLAPGSLQTLARLSDAFLNQRLKRVEEQVGCQR